VTSARGTEPITALTVGLAAIIICWTCAVAFALNSLEALGDYSPWLYGPAATAVWAVFSAVIYLLIRRNNRRKIPSSPHENYQCAGLHVTAPYHGASVCATRAEKDRLAAVTAGLAFTMSTWVVTLSLAPEGWMDALSVAPPWLYCLASAALWAGFSVTLGAIFRASSRRKNLRFN
jgi:ABC-type transport system involved in cytochrome c biogenesis permease subunit